MLAVASRDVHVIRLIPKEYVLFIISVMLDLCVYELCVYVPVCVFNILNRISIHLFTVL